VPAGQRSVQAIGLAEIGDDVVHVAIDSFRAANQHRHCPALFLQAGHQRASDEAVGAGDQGGWTAHATPNCS
jgi:transposase